MAPVMSFDIASLIVDAVCGLDLLPSRKTAYENPLGGGAWKGFEGRTRALALLCRVNRMFCRLASRRLVEFVTLQDDDLLDGFYEDLVRRAKAFEESYLPIRGPDIKVLHVGLVEADNDYLDDLYSRTIQGSLALTTIYIERTWHSVASSEGYPKTSHAISHHPSLCETCLIDENDPAIEDDDSYDFVELPASVLEHPPPQLTAVHLNCCILTPVVWLRLSKLPNLTSLTISDSILRPPLSNNPTFPNLKHLELDRVPFDSVVGMLRRSTMTHLTSLTLIGLLVLDPRLRASPPVPTNLCRLAFICPNASYSTPHNVLLNFQRHLIRSNPRIVHLTLLEQSWTAADVMTHVAEGELSELRTLRLEWPSLWGDEEIREKERWSILVGRRLLSRFLEKTKIALVLAEEQ